MCGNPVMELAPGFKGSVQYRHMHLMERFGDVFEDDNGDDLPPLISCSGVTQLVVRPVVAQQVGICSRKPHCILHLVAFERRLVLS